MSYYFVTASKDATVYLQQPNQNTGRDEILEVSKIYYGNVLDVSRAFLHFDLSFVSQSLISGLVGFDECRLIAYESDSEELPFAFDIECYPVSQSWDVGIGTRFDEISNQGITWNYREGESQLLWLDGTQFYNGATGSYAGRGGVFYASPSAVQHYEYGVTNLDVDVGDIVKEWFSGSVENNGFILKYPFAYESDVKDYGIIKFFSKETNTIYQPKLVFKWDDQVYDTGSLNVLGTDEIRVSLSNFKPVYRVNSIATINIYATELYPLKTFANAFNATNTNVLPEQTYYQVIDFLSKSVIIPFSEYSKVSGSNGNYFTLNFSNWEIDRLYEIQIKSVINGSEVFITDEVFKFKLIA